MVRHTVWTMGKSLCTSTCERTGNLHDIHNRCIDHIVHVQLWKHGPQSSLDQGNRPQRHDREVEEHNRDIDHQMYGNR